MENDNTQKIHTEKIYFWKFSDRIDMAYDGIDFLIRSPNECQSQLIISSAN